jgi:hypothetical protein
MKGGTSLAFRGNPVNIMREHELAMWLADLLKGGQEAAAAQGVDESTYERLMLLATDAETLNKAREIADSLTPGGRDLVDQWVNRILAGGRN